jgi:hypothetical protein
MGGCSHARPIDALLSHRHLRLDGVRNEANFVSFMMQVVQLRLVRSFAYPFDLRVQDNLRHSLLARCDFFHHALRMIVIGSHGKACHSGYV